MKDKNGKLIWENDIVKINNSKGNVLITFGDFEIICTIPNEKYYKHRLEYDTEYEVVGNIFDNAELLESERLRGATFADEIRLMMIYKSGGAVKILNIN